MGILDDKFKELDPTLKQHAESEWGAATATDWTAFTSGGVECEVGAFLYSLVKMIKPENVLETGTYTGISSSYMAYAMKENNKGKLITFEVNGVHYNEANKRWKTLGLDAYIDSRLQPSLDYTPDRDFELVLLDSEPNLRFAEFDKIVDNVVDGGIIVIHDLHTSLGQSGQIHHGVLHWPYGALSDRMVNMIKNHEMQTFNFFTPRGITIFQKAHDSFLSTKMLTEDG